MLDLMIKYNDSVDVGGNKQSMFMRKDNNILGKFNDDATSTSAMGVFKVSYSSKVRMIAEIESYPSVLTQVNPEQIIELTIETLKC